LNSRIEDLIGKILIIAIFVYLSFWQLDTILWTVRFKDRVDFWHLTFLSRVFGLIFLALTVSMTVLRLPPRMSASGLEPRVTAIAGTFCTMLLVVLPTATPGLEMRFLSTVLIVVGTLLSIACALWLGQSFSIMATARRLVIKGPYSVIRHPLYAAEAITLVGIVISTWSIASISVGALQFILQYRRILNEERVLSAAFPEYDAYAQRVPMLIPRLFGKGS
jgi:protein-S-isoprenylcysteine O-methyltransferase Ste14